MLFLCYDRCSTCKKAEKWLKDHGFELEKRAIREDNPTAEELKAWQAKSGKPIKSFFNTSGMKYRELGLSKRLPDMTDEEKFEILSSDGMLVKRPILVTENEVLIGFKEKEYEEVLG